MGWYNASLGVGTSTNAIEGTTYARRAFLDRTVLEALYRQCGVARKIVARMPLDATREGWDRYPEISEEEGRALQKEEVRLGLAARLTDALVYERLYGGAAVVVAIDDGGEPWEPLQPDRVRQVRSLYAAHRWELWPHTYIDDPDSPLDGQAEVYQVTRDQSSRTSYVHRSRMLIFGGDTLPGQARFDNWGWGDSILEIVWSEIRNAGVSDSGVIEYLLQLSVPLLKIRKWWELVGKEEGGLAGRMLSDLKKRMSAFRVLVLDADDGAERLNATVSGISEILIHQKAMVSAVTDYPQTLLYGDSPSGMSATGASDLELYYGIVKAKVQEDRLRPALDQVYPLIVRAPVWGGGQITNPLSPEVREREPDVEFRPLWVPKDLELAQAELTRAQARSAYAALGWIREDQGARLMEKEGLVEPDEDDGGEIDLSLPEVEVEEGGVEEDRQDAEVVDVVPWRGRSIHLAVLAGQRRGPVVMPCDYGEISGTVGLDGDPVDVLLIRDALGAWRDTVHAGVILHPDSGRLDEVKLVVGAADEHAAAAILVLCYGGALVGEVVEVESDFVAYLLSDEPRQDADVSEEMRTPSKAAAEAARRALEVRAEKPPSERGMTPVGLARARDISNRKPLSLQTWRRVKAYFDRHQSDKEGETWGEQGKGWQAWMGWGGDPARSQAERVVAAAEREGR